MRRTKILLLLLLLGGLLVAKERVQPGNNGIYLGLSLGGERFQDVTQSASIYSGGLGTFTFGYRRALPKSNFLRGSLSLTGGLQSATTNELSGIFALNIATNIRYIHKFRIDNRKWWILGSDILWDFSIRRNDRLQNNQLDALFHNDFTLVGGYGLLLKERPLELTVSLGLFSFVNKLNGFAFSENQKVLEEGAFSYDSEPELFYKNAQFRPIGKGYLALQTDLEYRFHPRWIAGYNWKLVTHRYKNIEGRRLVKGSHKLGMTFLF